MLEWSPAGDGGVTLVLAVNEMNGQLLPASVTLSRSEGSVTQGVEMLHEATALS